jgi:hypothetical protein
MTTASRWWTSGQACSQSFTGRPVARSSTTSPRLVTSGTDGEIAGLLLNREPFDFPGRELTTDAATWDWDTQMRVLPHVTGPHRQIPESHVFEDIMQLVDWVR